MVDIASSFQYTIVDPVAQFLNSLMFTLPGLVAAVLLIILGYLVGTILGKLVQQILDGLKVDQYIAKLAKGHPLGKVTVAELGGKLTKWYLFIAFVATAASIVQMGFIASLLMGFALWAPHLIAAAIIMAIGLFASEFIRAEISAFKADASKFIGVAAKYFVLIYFMLMALREVGLNVFLAEATVLIIVAGIMLALALGFGLALKDHADKLLEELKKAK
ncbi:Uncharacterised protein [uncultured archaeon]|nr:Uncharacterised protein [uncultured archaeon]